jgi:hypothetical protein
LEHEFKIKGLSIVLNIQDQEFHKEMGRWKDVPTPLWQNLRHVGWGRASRRYQKWNMGCM